MAEEKVKNDEQMQYEYYINNLNSTPDEYYINQLRKRETRRKVKNALIITCIGVVCILVVFAFTLTQCTMKNYDSQSGSVPTIPSDFTYPEKQMSTQDLSTENTLPTDSVSDKDIHTSEDKPTNIQNPEMEIYGQDVDY